VTINAVVFTALIVIAGGVLREAQAD
jgi:hypothetical protein